MREVTVRFPILLLLLAVLVPIASCTSHLASRQAEIAAQRGDWDQAVLEYMKAVEQSPENLAYKASLIRAKIKASQAHFEKGQEYEKAGVIERALIEYQQAVQLDTTNQYALSQLEHVRQAYAAQRANRESTTIDQLKKKTRGTRPQPPVLNPRSDKPIDMEFPEPVSIMQIYRALGQAFGINVLFDPNLKDQEIGIELKQVTAQSALETLMRAGNHFYKVIDEHTIIIAQDTPQNRRTYEDLVIQTFFLSNSEVKDMMTILRSLVDAKKIATNEQLNAIILRDTADKVKVAERIIEANDKSKAEVVIDVELLQINSLRLRDIGVSLSSYQVQQTLDTGAATPGTGTGGSTGGATSAGRVRVSDLEFLNQSNWFLTLPNFLYNFVKQNSDAQLLAKPQLRITEGEKASLVIGDKVPIPLTTFNTSNTVGGSVVPITSFQYQDVGIRIDLEPRVHHNREVTLKVKVAVDQINSYRGDQPIIGTRTIESVIRLQDGETNFLAGLIRSDEANSENGMPGLSEIPILGRLFSNKRTDAQRTDVILTLTPHIIRNAEITEEDLLPIWVGTEANITFRGGSPRVESDVDGPFETGEETPEEIQDAIRRRLQRLPRGLRPEDSGEMIDEGEGEVPEEQQPPPGIDLAPSAPPSDIFRPPTTNPLDSPPPNPPDSEDEDVEEPPGDQASVAPRALLGGNLRTERSAESAGATLRARTPAPVQVWLAPRNLKVNPGERFVVKVQASADRPISHLPLALAYDPAVLVVEQVERGTFPGEAQILVDASRPGEVVLGASRMGEVPGVTGQGTVALITFRAVRSGSTRIDFSRSKAMDAELQPVVPVRARSVAVSVR
ncbi:MAG TPA: secretin N-terminal domain-containing protein [Thermoanaerobaculia bacterium]|nr:secretin N-terminal domain-containing protein [Thermoanaerobaculia bacterium]